MNTYPARESNSALLNLEDSAVHPAPEVCHNHYTKICKVCQSPFTRKSKTKTDICSQNCSIKLRTDLKIQNWLDRKWSGGTEFLLSKTVRNYLLKKENFKCSKCGFNKTHPADNATILEINHIDGNGSNHSPTNLEVLCPNCHTLTTTFRGRNQGSGRNYTYIRKRVPTKSSKVHNLPNITEQYYSQTTGKQNVLNRKFKNLYGFDLKNYCSCGVMIGVGSFVCRTCNFTFLGQKQPTKIEWPSVNELQQRLAMSNYSKLGRELGVSDNAIRKHIKNHK